MEIFERGGDVLNAPRPEFTFWLDPYIPNSSIILLYGRSGIGKTAVCWEMAHAIQDGLPVWGMPTHKTNVLFLEFDTPRPLVQQRWVDAEPPFDINFTCIFEEISIDYRQLLSPVPDDQHTKIIQVLGELHRRKQFGVVFVDALREVVVGDLSNSGIARRVYDAFKMLFPGASIVFIHHERKSAADPKSTPDPLQAAAGSMEFINVAQVALNFRRRGRETWLDHGKTQASAEFEPLPISLRSDGVHVYHRNNERLEVARELIDKNPDTPKRELDKMIGEKLGMTDRSARVIRLGIEQQRKVG